MRATLAEFIRTRHADWKSQEFICFDDLGAFRKEYVKHVLEDEFGELTASGSPIIVGVPNANGVAIMPASDRDQK